MMKNLRLVKIVYVPIQGFVNETMNVINGSQTLVWEPYKRINYA